MRPRTKRFVRILLASLLLTYSAFAGATLLLQAPDDTEPLCLLQDERLCVDNGCEATGGVCLLVENPKGNRCICVY